MIRRELLALISFPAKKQANMTSTDQDRWQRVKHRLRTELGEDVFSSWFARMRQGHAFKEIDGHQAFEEIRGVIVARAGGVLSREDYRALGAPPSSC